MIESKLVTVLITADTLLSFQMRGKTSLSEQNCGGESLKSDQKSGLSLFQGNNMISQVAFGSKTVCNLKSFIDRIKISPSFHNCRHSAFEWGAKKSFKAKLWPWEKSRLKLGFSGYNYDFRGWFWLENSVCKLKSFYDRIKISPVLTSADF